MRYLVASDLHYTLPQLDWIADQAAEVQKVKRSQSGMITDPVTLPPTALLHEAEDLMHRFKFSGVPITEHCDRNRLSIEDRLALFLLVWAELAVGLFD